MTAFAAAAADEDHAEIQCLRARIQQLEDMLSAVGAGGVAPLMQAASSKHVEQHLGMVAMPRAVVEQALAAMQRAGEQRGSTAAEVEAIEALRAALDQPPKSTTSMSSSQPSTDYQVEQLAHRTCWRYRHSPDPHHSHTYTFNRHTLLEFARALREGGAA